MTARQRLQIRLSHDWGPRLASRLRQRWVRLRNPLADISFGAGCRLGPGFSLQAPWGGRFHCGPGCEFRRGFRAELAGPDATVAIGDATRFTYDVVIQCAGSITIGAGAMFAAHSMVVDGSHRFRDLDVGLLDQGYDLRTIHIGDGVGVMAKTTVIADVGTRAFVGANALVSRPIPPYTVAVGVPARVVDYFGPPGQEPEGWPRDG